MRLMEAAAEEAELAGGYFLVGICLTFASKKLEKGFVRALGNAPLPSCSICCQCHALFFLFFLN